MKVGFSLKSNVNGELMLIFSSSMITIRSLGEDVLTFIVVQVIIDSVLSLSYRNSCKQSQ